MKKERALEILIEIETKAIRFANRSFECGAHTNDETQLEMRKADADFSSSLSKLREVILSEGVEA